MPLALGPFQFYFAPPPNAETRWHRFIPTISEKEKRKITFPLKKKQTRIDLDPILQVPFGPIHRITSLQMALDRNHWGEHADYFLTPPFHLIYLLPCHSFIDVINFDFMRFAYGGSLH